MKDNLMDHRARSWRVHDVAPDFELIDLWQFDLGEGTPDLRAVLAGVWGSAALISGSRLAKARTWIGRALRWDDHDFTLPIPGCEETSVAARLAATDRAANRARPDAASPLEVPLVKTVYVFDKEALYEFSNDTIHGLLHVGMTSAASASLAVYVKSRGTLSRLYMAAIRPFRHAIVYPAFIRHVEESVVAKGTV